MLFKQISLKDTYQAIEWPVIVMLGCLIPVGEALKDTGAAGVVADLLSLGAHAPARRRDGGPHPARPRCC